MPGTRLAEYLAETVTARPSFVINRSFEADPATVFGMLTRPEHISRWLPPVGFEMEFVQVGVQPGGCGFYKMYNGAGVTFFGKIEYREIDSPHRLVYTQKFCDEQGNPARHPGAPVWPETLLTTVIFADEGNDSTRVTVTWEPYGAASPEEIQAFLDARPGMTQGWTGSFDKLENQLNKITLANSPGA